MNRSEIEQQVTDSIIVALEMGVAPWRKPWTGGAMLPVSVATNKPYRGINTLILWSAQVTKRYQQPYWLTYKQAKAMGGQVRKGEKATTVVFWKVVSGKQRDEATGEMVDRTVPLLRTYNVFNVEQVDGLNLPPRFQPGPAKEPVAVLDGLQTIFEGYADGPTLLTERGDRAFYTPSTDTVTMPALDQFTSPEGYAETFLHELVHSTGHKSRLDRFEPGSGAFGCEGYAREELVAEIGMALLAAEAGIDVKVEQTAAYVGSWLKALKDDRSLIIKAAQQAQRAVDRIAPAVEVVEEQEEAMAA